MTSTTTNIQLSTEVSEQLNHAELFLHRGKDWIITHAIERYLSELEPPTLANEAKRQSVCVSQCSGEEKTIWKDGIDVENWR